ncbi:DedA family protein [Azospirillum sp. RWY-5-1]|uniref:DedA family protein n=1 Tax=Azospirillum oleiclasticum TaxID=2735135 RepID=A0ABX2TEW7_9PROT|nr:YqaA family protein [Azospirillum oleiclasticum]NYZ16909.1 DedA family protein [Azospirillum oleiclasticum]NYZ21846.1 DedA family protein [Azospirillum oleiclasticum]
MDDLATLVGLFLTSLLAATVFPAQSEILLGALHMSETHTKAVLVAVATAGNVLGSVVNWLLGRYLIHFQDRRWFPVKRSLIDRATAWYQRWGFWSLLLAWAPFIGDPLTLVAGILRENIWVFLALVTIGKAVRYVAVVMAV